MIDAALDVEGDATESLVSTIVEKQQANQSQPAEEQLPSNAAAGAAVALRAELVQLRPRALRTRARQMGVDEGAMEEALDADDVAEALIAIIVAHHHASKTGSTGGDSAAMAAAGEAGA